MIAGEGEIVVKLAAGGSVEVEVMGDRVSVYACEPYSPVTHLWVSRDEAARLAEVFQRASRGPAPDSSGPSGERP